MWIALLNKGKNISYAGCGLPYYVGHVIENKEELIVNTPLKYEKLTGVKVLTEVEAINVEPYAGCGLPYYVGHVIENKEELIVNTPLKYEKLTGVKVLTEVEAINVEPEAKKVTAVDLKTQETKENTPMINL